MSEAEREEKVNEIAQGLIEKSHERNRLKRRLKSHV